MKRSLTVGLALVVAIGAVVLAQQKAPSAETLMGEALHHEEVAGNLDAAIAAYKKVIADSQASRALVASALLRLGRCYERLGNVEARKAYDRLTREFGDQAQAAAQARARLTALDAGKTSTAETGIVARQLWTGRDVDLEGKPSPDGRYVAFIDWTSTPTGNVAVRDLSTGKNRLLTHDTAVGGPFAETVVFSPDGKQLAFVSDDLNKTSVRTIGIDGSRLRSLIERSDIHFEIGGWSPNGQHLVARGLDRDRTHFVALISTADGAVTRLKSTTWQYPDVGGFSPDGRFVAYTLAPNPGASDGGVFAIAADGSREVVLLKDSANAGSPSWTADGKAVVFVSDRSGTNDLWMVRFADGRPNAAPELLRAGVGNVTGMGFTQDGSYFYGITHQPVDVYTAALDPSALTISRLERLTDKQLGTNGGAAWSPDGRYVAFVRSKERRAATLVVRALATGVERTLATRLDDAMAARAGIQWFPDGRSLFVPDSVVGRRWLFRRVDVETGKDEVVFEDSYSAIWYRAALSPDGRALYFTRREPGAQAGRVLRLMKRDLEHGSEIELYRTEAESPGAGFFGLAVSPDGSRLLFSANIDRGRRLMTVSTDGGKPVELYNGDYGHPSPQTGAWTADNRYVLVTFSDGDSSEPRVRQRLVAIPATGGTPRRLDLQMPQIQGASVSPDGRRLLITGLERVHELWTFKNLIPSVRASQ